MSIVARLEELALEPEKELAALILQARGDGAVVSLVGLARHESKGGQSLDRLVLQHHPALTQQSLQQITVAAAERFDVSQVPGAHRCGECPAGAPLVSA